METLEWQKEQSGAFIAETDSFKLIVHWIAVPRQARFQVLARLPAGLDALIGSGTTESVGEAMDAAEKMATRSPAIVKPPRTSVILVDDDDMVRRVVAEALRENGYQVAEVATGEGALRRLERTAQPTILVADVNLGEGMSGLQLAAAVHQQWPMTGILMVSGDDAPLDAQALQYQFLAKPFTTNRLLWGVAGIAARMQRDCPPSLN